MTTFQIFCYCNVIMASGAHMDAVLNKLAKSELMQLLLNTEANLGSQISGLFMKVKDMLNPFKQLETGIALVRNVNDKLVERLFQSDRQCWENTQYLRLDTFEIVGIPSSVENNILEETVCSVFKEIGAVV